jgi:hypothetical protein
MNFNIHFIFTLISPKLFFWLLWRDFLSSSVHTLCLFAVAWVVLKNPTKACADFIQFIDNFKDIFMSFQIIDCPWWRRCPKESLMADSCLWETSINSDSSLPDCQAYHGICMKTPSGNCGWSTDKKYRECMKNRRRFTGEKLRKEPWTTQRNSSWIMIWGHWY